MKSNALSYHPQIDGLRFVAIACVFYEHFGFNPFQQYGNPWLSLDPGYYGVDLFFVISGFLITSILLQDSSPSGLRSYKTFMGRRMLRIFPIYYLLLIVLFALDIAPIREISPWLFTYTFNYGSQLVEDTGGFFYLWSLSVEEQFYLAWPLIAIALRRHPRFLLAITAGIVGVGYSQLTFNLFPQMSQFNYTGLINRMGSLGLGALGAQLEIRYPISDRWLKSILLEVVALLLLGFVLFTHFPGRFPLMGICSLFLVIKASRSCFRIQAVARFLENRHVIYVGAISYGLYLFHIPIGMLVTKWVFDPIWVRIPFESWGFFEIVRWHSWLVKLPLISAITIAVAAFSFRFIEKPILAGKDRWFPYQKSGTFRKIPE